MAEVIAREYMARSDVFRKGVHPHAHDAKRFGHSEQRRFVRTDVMVAAATPHEVEFGCIWHTRLVQHVVSEVRAHNFRENQLTRTPLLPQ